MNQEKPQHGGRRPNQHGRPPLTKEQRAEREQAKRQVLLDELLFPSLITALRAEDKGYDKHLEVALSACQIEMAYGKEGLTEWKSYFDLAKPGGIDTKKVAYCSRWKLNIHKQMMAKKLLASVGMDITNLPYVEYPPAAMTERVAACQARRLAKKEKKLSKMWNEMEATGKVGIYEQLCEEALA